MRCCFRLGKTVSKPANRTIATRTAVRKPLQAEARRGAANASTGPFQYFMISSTPAENGVDDAPGCRGTGLLPAQAAQGSNIVGHGGPWRATWLMRVERLTSDDHLHLHLLYALGCSQSSSSRRLCTFDAGMSQCAGCADSSFCCLAT